MDEKDLARREVDTRECVLCVVVIISGVAPKDLEGRFPKVV